MDRGEFMFASPAWTVMCHNLYQKELTKNKKTTTCFRCGKRLKAFFKFKGEEYSPQNEAEYAEVLEGNLKMRVQFYCHLGQKYCGRECAKEIPAKKEYIDYI